VFRSRKLPVCFLHRFEIDQAATGDGAGKFVRLSMSSRASPAKLSTKRTVRPDFEWDKARGMRSGHNLAASERSERRGLPHRVYGGPESARFADVDQSLRFANGGSEGLAQKNGRQTKPLQLIRSAPELASSRAWMKSSGVVEEYARAKGNC
jgi:hypothetical protein